MSCSPKRLAGSVCQLPSSLWCGWGCSVTAVRGDQSPVRGDWAWQGRKASADGCGVLVSGLPPAALPAHDQHLLSLRSASIQTYSQRPLIRHHREPGGADLLRARRLPTLRVLLVQGRDPDANGAQKQPCLQQFLLHPEPQDRGAGMDGESGGQGYRTPEGCSRTRNRVSMAFGSGQER